VNLLFYCRQEFTHPSGYCHYAELLREINDGGSNGRQILASLRRRYDATQGQRLRFSLKVETLKVLRDQIGGHIPIA
jgi:hypothetical protein